MYGFMWRTLSKGAFGLGTTQIVKGVTMIRLAEASKTVGDIRRLKSGDGSNFGLCKRCMIGSITHH